MTFRPLISLCLLATACAPATNGHGGAAAATAHATASTAHLDLDGLDRKVAPGDNFFAFANGGWLASHDIPPDRASFGVGAVLDELTSKRTAELIADAAKGDATPGSDARKIGDYYASFLDEAAIEKRGLDPVKPMLERVAA